MIISEMYPGIATANVEERANLYTEKFGFTIKHRLVLEDCKIYIMENQYTEMDLVEGSHFKPGSSVFRIAVRDFDDSIKDAVNEGLVQIGDVIDGEKIKIATFTNADGTIYIISHHKKINIYV